MAAINMSSIQNYPHCFIIPSSRYSRSSALCVSRKTAHNGSQRLPPQLGFFCKIIFCINGSRWVLRNDSAFEINLANTVYRTFNEKLIKISLDIIGMQGGQSEAWQVTAAQIPREAAPAAGLGLLESCRLSG